MNHNPLDPYDRWKKPYPNPYVGDPPHKHPEDKWQKPVPPKPVTIADLFPRLDRLSIGWSPLLETLKEFTNNKPSYPPYDIVALKDDVNLLNVAVAGFSKEDLSVVLQDSVITIEGKKVGKAEGEIVYQGIAARDFKLELAVADFWKVKDATVKDGMLTVTFEKELPEEKKPKVIDIS
jgi:molecular chaperone IbpA